MEYIDYIIVRCVMGNNFTILVSTILTSNIKIQFGK